ncbi:MAG: NAD(P)-dependent oxidoreductase [Candidatus Paceibacterota bacterium]
MLTTLIAESHNYSDKALKVYKSLGRVLLVKKDNKVSKKKQILNDINILVIRNLTQVDKKLINLMPKLKVLASPTTGLNHIDVNYLNKKNIKLISLRGQTKFLETIPSTAEHTMALLLSLVRHIPWSFDEVKKGNWPRDEFIGNQLKNKTIGILGYGRLGKIVAKYCKAFDMNIISCDPNVSKEVILKNGVKKVGFDELFKKSDIVSIHVLLTENTKNLIKEKHFRMMKRDSIFINTSRGEIIEKNALYNALKEKFIKAAAVDVMWDERKNGNHLKRDPLWKYAKTYKNLLISSHLGGVSYEAMEETENFIADLVKKHIKNNKYTEEK